MNTGTAALQNFTRASPVQPTVPVGEGAGTHWTTSSDEAPCLQARQPLVLYGKEATTA